MKSRVITFFLVAFFAFNTSIVDANNLNLETKIASTDSIEHSQDTLNARNAQFAADSAKDAERKRIRQDSIRVADAQERAQNALKRAKQDSINAQNAKQREAIAREQSRKDSINAANAQERAQNALKKAKQDSINAQNATLREAKAREQLRQDSITVALLQEDKENAYREVEHTQLLLEKVIHYSLILLIFFITIIVIMIIVISRHKKKRNMDDKIMQSSITPNADRRPESLVKSTNGDTFSHPQKNDSSRSVENVPKGKVKDIVTIGSSTESPISTNGYNYAANWVVVGASVKGNGHIQSNMPCQDNNMFESLSNGWGIAIVSDGAGSAAHSDLGSKIVASRGIFHFKKLIENEGWIEKRMLPTDVEWLQKSYAVLKDIRTDVMMVAQKNNTDIKALSATCLVVIYSPFGLLTVHVGDGRMGYKTLADEWKPMMTPHKGEEANQTIFLVSDFWSIPQYTMSGVLVPESMVIREPVKAFALMSDGCENTAWLCTALNSETGKYFDRNLPFAGFFNPLEETLLTFSKEHIPVEERQEKWFKFIESGTSGFVKEQDDKTMIYAVNVELIK